MNKMDRKSPGLFGVLALVAALLLAAACALNPATGKRQFVLVSESQELAMGRESDKSIVAEMGLYDDEGLQEYIQALGARMAAKSERPGLDWTFRVVDDPIVNAFALPGGYIYITRGIMAHLQSEAELATVVGHEIGHVTARHSVSQISKAQVAQIGLGVGSILAPEQAERFGGLVQSGMGLLFLKFGRDDERQADDLGLRYMFDTGYDPRPAAGVFDTLARVGEAAGGGSLPAWASSHPAPENRKERIEERIAELGVDLAGRPTEFEDYARRIDGLVFGEDPRQGYFDEEVFLHPQMAFRIELPSGWKRRNLRSAVIAVSPEQDAAVQLTLAREDTAEAALGKFLTQEGVRPAGEPMGSIHGLPTAGRGFRFTSGEQTLEGRVGFVEHQGRVFQLLGYTSQAGWPNRESTIRRSLASFDRVTDRRVLDVQPKRLRTVRLDRTMTLEQFAERNDSSVPTDTLALINRLDPGESLPAGRAYKIVTGGDLP